MRWFAYLILASLTGGGITGGGLNAPATGISSFTITASRTTADYPAGIFFDAAATFTGDLAGRDLMDCLTFWEFGDIHTGVGESGEAVPWPNSTNQHMTKNQWWSAPYAFHAYVEPTEHWGVTASDSITVTATLRCMDSSGTVHQAQDTEGLTLNDTVLGRANAYCIYPNGGSAASCATGTTQVQLAPGNDLAAEVAARGANDTVIQIVNAADGTYVWDTLRTFAHNDFAILQLDGNDTLWMAQTTNPIPSANDQALTMSGSRTAVAGIGLDALTVPSNANYVAFTNGSTSSNNLFYKIGSRNSYTSAFQLDTDEAVSNYSAVVDSIHDRTGLSMASGALDQNGTYINNWGRQAYIANQHIMADHCSNNARIACLGQYSIIAANNFGKIPDHTVYSCGGGVNTGVKWHDTCSVSGNKALRDTTDTHFAYNKLWRGEADNTTGAAYLMDIHPQNITTDNERWERHLRIIFEGNIGLNRGATAQNNTIVKTATQAGRYRQNVYVHDPVSLITYSPRVIDVDERQDNCGTTGKIWPDHEPPSGCVTNQLGGNDAFNNVLLDYASNGRHTGLGKCLTVGGTDDVDRCGDGSNNQFLTEGTGNWSGCGNTINCVGNIDKNSLDLDTYFTGYTQTQNPNDMVLDDFQSSTPDTGANNELHFWGPNRTEATWDSFNAGLYQ